MSRLELMTFFLIKTFNFVLIKGLPKEAKMLWENAILLTFSHLGSNHMWHGSSKDASQIDFSSAKVLSHISDSLKCTSGVHLLN